ncbi:MAG: RpoL/Rpb11 RNA polymerase subunit family protein [Candidatus Micrarchaeales archaeon]|jgi:DNA-directed RNA polymerase subunit L
MKVNIIEDEAKSFVVEFEGVDRGIAELIKEKLSENKEVEFASVEKDHPQTGLPRLVVKSSKSAKGQVVKAIEALEEEIKDIASEMPKK